MLQRLSSSLVKHAGLTLKRVLGATLSDLNFVPLWSTSIMVVGATKDNTEAAGLFKWDANIPRNKHDGGTIISPNVTFTDMESFLIADGGQGDGCWVRVIDSDCLFSSWYSPSLLSKHSDMILKMWDSARYLGKNLKFGAGEFIIDKPLVLDINVGTSWQPRFGNIYGAGGTSTFFVLDILGGLDPSSRAVRIQGGIGTANEAVNVFTMQGVGFRCNDKSAEGRMRGIGLHVHQVHTFRFIDCLWTNLNTGILLEDSLYGYWETCILQGNRTAVYARKGATTTSMNLVKFVRCNINSNREYCLRLIETSAVNLDSCSFEGNGTADATGVIKGQACIHLSNIGGAGSVGLTATNCYFEANPMRDVYIDHNGNRDVEHVFDRCLFHPTQSAYHGRILIRNSSAAEKSCVLVIRDSRCLLENPHAFLETSGFAGKSLGSAFYNLNNTINGAISLEPQVSHFYGYGEGFSAIFKDTLRDHNNVISISKTETGTYQIRTNLPDLDMYNVSVTPVNPTGSGTGVMFDFNPDQSNKSVATLYCRDASKGLVDTAFRITATRFRFATS